MKKKYILILLILFGIFTGGIVATIKHNDTNDEKN